MIRTSPENTRDKKANIYLEGELITSSCVMTVALTVSVFTTQLLASKTLLAHPFPVSLGLTSSISL